jgi:hypothetical protein
MGAALEALGTMHPAMAMLVLPLMSLCLWALLWGGYLLGDTLMAALSRMTRPYRLRR